LEPNNGLSGAKIALLVDFDNVVLGLEEPGFDIELVVNALRERGTIVLGRVYGDWYRHNRHRRKLMEQGLELVETPAFGPVIKNSADIRIALDGFEIGLTQSHIDTFAIVSGDSDFLPLIKKLQSLGRRVLVICGNRFTSDMLRRNCNEFISYENLLAQSIGATEDATTLEGAFSLLHRAMAALRERGSEIRGSGVKQMMLQLNPVFSERTFGCTQFRQFLQKAVNAGVVKLGARDKYSGEFSVLLPDEDEVPVQQKFERRQETRGRRDDKIAQIAARIESVPVAPIIKEEEYASEAPAQNVLPNGESDYTPQFDEGGAVWADDAFGYEPEAMAEARTESAQEIAQNVIARSELLARGLRPSKRRFSGRNGRTPLEVREMNADELEDADMGDEGFDVPVEEPSAPEPEAVLQIAEAPAQATESRRLRSRRRRRNAAGQITVVAEDATPAEPETQAEEREVPLMESERQLLEDDATPTALVDISPDSPIEFSHEPLSDEEGDPEVEDAQAIEAPADEMATIQSALNQLAGTQTEATDTQSDPLDISKGIEVEATAPPLSPEQEAIDARNPMGNPVPAEAIQAKRRRSARSKKTSSAAPETATPAEPEAVAASIEAQSAPAPVEAVEENAPSKTRRRRPSRTNTSVKTSDTQGE